MIISEMSHAECTCLLERGHLGHLACSLQDQPYVSPVHFAYEDGYIYSFSTMGRKIAWMRKNPRVCIEAAELENRDLWRTVIATGSYEELTDDAPGSRELRQHAHALLSRRASWWEPAYARKTFNTAETIQAVYFRILLDNISGRSAASSTVQPDIARPPQKQASWLKRLFSDQ